MDCPCALGIRNGGAGNVRHVNEESLVEFNGRIAVDGHVKYICLLSRRNYLARQGLRDIVVVGSSRGVILRGDVKCNVG